MVSARYAVARESVSAIAPTAAAIAGSAMATSVAQNAR